MPDNVARSAPTARDRLLDIARSTPRRSTLLLSTVAVTTAATPAHATTWTAPDGFEVSPASRWTISASAPTGTGGFSGSFVFPRTGSLAAWIYAKTGFTSVGRTFSLPPATFLRTCTARVYLHEFSTPGLDSVNLEIINPSTWTYVAVQHAVVATDGYDYIPVSVSFVGGPNTVVLRVSLLAQSGNPDWYWYLGVDDVTVTCAV